MKPARIAVVGPCASGKSTLVERLREAGYEARSIAQEHSIIADLWSRSNPDVVVFLNVNLEDLRVRRRKPDWPEWLYEEQARRLRDAKAHADIQIDTSALDPDGVEQELLTWLAERGYRPQASDS